MLNLKTFIILAMCLPLFSYAHTNVPSNLNIKREIIHQSITSYPGKCPCPYSTYNKGKLCGKRSAWHKGNVNSPFCYPSDITKQMLKNYKNKLELRMEHTGSPGTRIEGTGNLGTQSEGTGNLGTQSEGTGNPGTRINQ